MVGNYCTVNFIWKINDYDDKITMDLRKMINNQKNA